MQSLAHHVVTWVIVSYLLAAIPVGVLLGKLKGIDIRTVGSGNIGATNAIRALGPRLGSLVLMLDVAKAALPVILARQSFALGPEHHAGIAAVAMAAVLGHIFPVYLGFRGGKGVACGLGVFLAIDPPVALAALVIYVQTLVLTRTSALGSLTAVTSLTLTVVLAGRAPPYQLLSLGVALVIWLRHASNIRGLIATARARKRAASVSKPS